MIAHQPLGRLSFNKNGNKCLFGKLMNVSPLQDLWKNNCLGLQLSRIFTNMFKYAFVCWNLIRHLLQLPSRLPMF